jgi:hypothetical protein
MGGVPAEGVTSSRLTSVPKRRFNACAKRRESAAKVDVCDGATEIDAE